MADAIPIPLLLDRWLLFWCLGLCPPDCVTVLRPLRWSSVTCWEEGWNKSPPSLTWTWWQGDGVLVSPPSRNSFWVHPGVLRKGEIPVICKTGSHVPTCTGDLISQFSLKSFSWRKKKIRQLNYFKNKTKSPLQFFFFYLPHISWAPPLPGTLSLHQYKITWFMDVIAYRVEFSICGLVVSYSNKSLRVKF